MNKTNNPAGMLDTLNQNDQQLVKINENITLSRVGMQD